MLICSEKKMRSSADALTMRLSVKSALKLGGCDRDRGDPAGRPCRPGAE